MSLSYPARVKAEMQVKSRLPESLNLQLDSGAQEVHCAMVIALGHRRLVAFQDGSKMDRMFKAEFSRPFPLILASSLTSAIAMLGAPILLLISSFAAGRLLM